MKIKSSITGGTKVVKEDSISTRFIIENYRKQLGVDVRKYFKNLKEVAIYKCIESGYRFYVPTSLDGKDDFYHSLSKHHWYYMDWKWEHQMTYNLISKKDVVLEIGCGNGSFLKKIKGKCRSCVGLELNSNINKYKEINILFETVQEHSLQNKGKYSLVCSFQVLEHIADVRGFILAAIKTLKPGGKLIFSVPNNTSLIFETNDDLVLNAPPHHMGLWDINSLISLQKFFPILVDSLYIEPLQEYHQGYAQKMIPRGKDFSTNIIKRLMSTTFNKVQENAINQSVKALLPYIAGHTILIVYTKK